LLDDLAGPNDRLWPHNRWPAMREDLLDRAELAVTGVVASPARWSPWVRLLRGGPGQRRAGRPRVWRRAGSSSGNRNW
jgi:hypothetical protein